MESFQLSTKMLYRLNDVGIVKKKIWVLVRKLEKIIQKVKSWEKAGLTEAEKRKERCTNLEELEKWRYKIVKPQFNQGEWHWEDQ